MFPGSSRNFLRAYGAIFECGIGLMKETGNDAVMERVDAEGRVIGFSVLGVSRFNKDKPLVAELAAA